MRPVRACVTPFALPLVRPVHTGHGTLFNRAGILLEIEDSRSLKGYGEATPLPGFQTERVEEACDALARFLPAFLREKQWSIEEILEKFRIAFPTANTALSAIDTALCDLFAKQQDCSVAALLAGEFQTEVTGIVKVNALLQSQDLKEILEEAEKRWSEGFRTFKIKVGVQSIEQDIDRVGAVRKTLGEGAKIRLDANEAWTPEEAERALPALSSLSIEYLEQPLPAHNLQGAAALRKKSTIFLAADEAACSPGAIKTVLNHQAADIIILKPGATGGPHLSMQMGCDALGFNVPCVTTTLMDGAVGRAMATHVAAALPASGEPYACGFATGELLAQDLADGLKTRDGRIAVDQVKGLGVVVRQEQLARVATGKTMEFSV